MLAHRSARSAQNVRSVTRSPAESSRRITAVRRHSIFAASKPAATNSGTGTMLGLDTSVVLADVVVGYPIILGGWWWPGVDSGRLLTRRPGVALHGLPHREPRLLAARRGRPRAPHGRSRAFVQARRAARRRPLTLTGNPLPLSISADPGLQFAEQNGVLASSVLDEEECRDLHE